MHEIHLTVVFRQYLESIIFGVYAKVAGDGESKLIESYQVRTNTLAYQLLLSFGISVALKLRKILKFYSFLWQLTVRYAVSKP